MVTSMVAISPLLSPRRGTAELYDANFDKFTACLARKQREKETTSGKRTALEDTRGGRTEKLARVSPPRRNASWAFGLSSRERMVW
jgi:hypothetical protein